MRFGTKLAAAGFGHFFIEVIHESLGNNSRFDLTLKPEYLFTNQKLKHVKLILQTVWSRLFDAGVPF